MENQPDEICRAVNEWLESQSNQQFDWNPCLQSEFYTLLEKRTSDVFYNNEQQSWKNISVEVYHHLRARISPQYLRNCWEYGPYLQDLTERYRKMLNG